MGEFVLKLDPSERVLFTGKKLGEEPIQNQLKIINPTSDRYVYKVKCTSNEMFRIRPPVGVVEGGKDVVVTLVFNAGKAVPDNGKHYFVVYYLKSTDEKKSPRQAWADHKGDPEGTKRLYVDFKKEGGDKADEKKEDKPKDEKKDDKAAADKDDKKKEEKGDKDKDKEGDKKEGEKGGDDEKKDNKDEKDEKEDEKDDKKEDKKEDEKKE